MSLTACLQSSKIEENGCIGTPARHAAIMAHNHVHAHHIAAFTFLISFYFCQTLL